MNSDCSALFWEQLFLFKNTNTFRKNTGNINHPSPRCIRLIIATFKTLCIVADRQHPGRSRTVRNIDNIESERQDFTYSTQKSVRRHSEELLISKTSLCYPYKIQLVQKIDQNDYEKSFQFARLSIEILQHEEKICSLLMTDEAHFHLNAFVNKQKDFKWEGITFTTCNCVVHNYLRQHY